jgi:hypothetical protein
MRTIAYVPAGTAVPAAGTYTLPILGLRNPTSIIIQAQFVFGSGTLTTSKYFLQTTPDSGVTWRDLACLAFTTASGVKTSVVNAGIVAAAAMVASDGALTDDTIANGYLCSSFRVKNIIANAYTASTYGIYIAYQPD